MPRPNLTGELQKLLDAAVEAARLSDQARERAWRAIVAARVPGISDEVLCDETGFSRATLNRRFGPRKATPGDPGE